MKRAKYAGIGAAAIVIIMYAFLFWITPKPSEALEQRGLFGDSFGAINALFSGLALAGIVAALFYQHLEIDESIKQQAEIIKWQKLQIRLQALSTAREQLRESAAELQGKMKNVKQPITANAKTGKLLNPGHDYTVMETQCHATDAKLLELIRQTEQVIEQALNETG